MYMRDYLNLKVIPALTPSQDTQAASAPPTHTVVFLPIGILAFPSLTVILEALEKR